MDPDFDELVDMARNVLAVAIHNFDAGDREGDRYAAFALVCLSEAARRHVILSIDNPGAMFLTYVDYWTAIQAGESPPQPPFRVIQGGKN